MKRILSILALLTLSYGASSSAEVLIKVNVNNPDVVEFYAVAGAVSQASSSAYSTLSGVTLIGILENPQSEFSTSYLTGSLRSAGDGLDALSYLYPSDGFANSLNIFELEGNGGNTQEFVVGAAAFFGQGIADEDFLDFFDLKDVGATGNIVAGHLGNNTSEVLGQWEIVSEAPADASGQISLEEPIHGKVHGGIGNLRGFAFFDQDIERVEVYLDGVYAFDAPYGGSREDVAAVFPDFDTALNSGFSLAYGYSNLAPGEHSIRVVAVGADGILGDDTAVFTVVGFEEIFIGANAIVDGSNAQISMDGDEIDIESVQIGNFTYDITMKWRTAEQGFEIIRISEDL